LEEPLSMPKILLVEDNEMNRDMLSRRLQRRGFEVVTAVDGALGLEATKAEKPDLVLMDLSLPVMDGLEATRRIKADAETRGIPGRKVETIVADGKSDWPTFAAEAERLITKEHVSAVFGCWTSASRKTVKPVFEKYDHLLFYPLEYEGLEASPNIIYTGSSPN